MDRAIRRAVPRPVADARPAPGDLGGGLWALDRQLVHFGVARMTTRTTIVRLGDGSLVVISPPPVFDRECVPEIDSIGRVASVVAPNSFHYLYAAAFMRHYPDAVLRTAPGLLQRSPELSGAVELGTDPPSAWRRELEYVVLGPVRGLSEVLFFHRPSQTIILTDLAFNMLEYPRTIDRIVFRMNGIPAGFGPGRTSRSLLLRERDPAERCLARAAEWPIRRIVLAHGEVIETDAASRFRRAFAAYLPDQGRTDPEQGPS